MTGTPPNTIACSFCGKGQDGARKLFEGMGVDWNSNVFGGHICSACIALFMNLMANADREEFDRMVAEARAFKFP